jgi:hypothetical protein
MKKLFIFKIHEDCSYVDGMIAVIASSFKEAKQLLLDLTYAAVFDSCGNYRKLIDVNGTISESKVDHLIGNDKYNNYWYLAGSYELRDAPIVSEVKHVAYHNG